MKLQELKKIGLTEGEIKVYNALLELGECTKTTLAKQAGIAPSNIYDVTNRLIEKGLISKVQKNHKAHFSPANPNHIFNFLEDKEKEIQQERDFVKDILPSLLTKFQKTKEKVNVEVFQGWKGMKTIFDDLLEECKKGDENFIFGASKGEESEHADWFFTNFSKQREKKGIITHIIFNEELKKRKERINFFLKSRKYYIKFLQQSTPSEIMLYKNKSNIIILSKEPIIIRITSKEVNHSFKQHFDLLWKLARK
jgi:HTH-type transcriptional regulator, sugar sensing transcriptional regulator